MFDLEKYGDVIIAEPNSFPVDKTPEELICGALDNPCGSGPLLEEFIRGARNIIIIVNDATRPTPTPIILKRLFEKISHAGLKKENITILVATGAHRPPAEDEYMEILGGLYNTLRSRCIHHDCHNSKEMKDLGLTGNGTPVKLNKLLFDADKIIVTGSVEPHYFAGFTGGRKAFLPGLASFETIEANHKLALSPNARSLALKGNPVHEDMMDALKLIKAPVFSIMAVLDKNNSPAAIKAGDIIESFNAAAETARKIFCVRVPCQADIVVSVAKYPMDIDLYQSQKAIDNGALILNNGGFLILVSSCRKGIGDETYAGLLSQAASPAEALELIKNEFRLGYHKAAKMAAVSQRASIMAVTELAPEQLKKMFIKSAASVQTAMDEAISSLAARGIDKPKIVFLPDGCVTVPEL